MKVRLLAMAIMLVGAVGLYWAFAAPGNAPVAGGGYSRPAPAVEAGEVKIGSVVRRVEAVGSLRANESITVRPELPGLVDAIHFREGEFIEAGAKLISLENSIYQAEVQEKVADRRLAEINFKRADELVSKKASPVDVRDRALAQLQADTAAVELAEARLAKTSIAAPFSGVMGLRNISVGDFVNTGQDLVALVDLDPIKVDFRVGEIYLSQIATGQTIEITVDAYPAETFVGRVFAIEPQVDINGRAVFIRAELSNADGRLRPGLFSRVSLIVDAAAEAVLVPEEAIVPRGDQHFVYRLDNDRALLTEVTLGQRRATQVEIAAGLARGDTVVTAGQLKLRDGVQVRVIEASP